MLKELFRNKDHRNLRWQDIDWKRVTYMVRQLQSRIVKAEKEGNPAKAQRLRSLLLHSFSAKLLAVRQVVSNRGKRTPGVDGVVWNTPQAKMQAAMQLVRKGYRAYPLKRVYIPNPNGKFRALGIPTMKDRALQALYALALNPIAELYADVNSYGFRKLRGTADAIQQCFNVFSNRNGAQWIWKVDITGFYDNLSMDWLLEHIPMDNDLLQEWIEAGYIENGTWHETGVGTPQGSLISPTLCNLVLDGIESLLEHYCQTQGKTYRKKHRIRFVRYADDFIITGDTREVLEQEIRPLLAQFLAERGLRLSEKKTRLTRIQEGFDFVGFHLQRFRGTLIITPSKSAIREVKSTIRHIIATHKGASATTLLKRLNPVIRGWAYFYRQVVSKKYFRLIDQYIGQRLWYWVKRRHRDTSRPWILKKYFFSVKDKPWLFSDGEGATIFQMTKVPIRRHPKIKGDFNPYDPAWEAYLETRRERHVPEHVQSLKRRKLWLWQNGRCPYCGGVLDKDRDDCGWSSFQVHHVVLVSQGGTEALKNLRLLHDVCHRQLHACHEEATVPVAA